MARIRKANERAWIKKGREEKDRWEGREQDSQKDRKATFTEKTSRPKTDRTEKTKNAHPKKTSERAKGQKLKKQNQMKKRLKMRERKER